MPFYVLTWLWHLELHLRLLAKEWTTTTSSASSSHPSSPSSLGSGKITNSMRTCNWERRCTQWITWPLLSQLPCISWSPFTRLCSAAEDSIDQGWVKSWGSCLAGSILSMLYCLQSSGPSNSLNATTTSFSSKKILLAQSKHASTLATSNNRSLSISLLAFPCSQQVLVLQFLDLMSQCSSTSTSNSSWAALELLSRIRKMGLNQKHSVGSFHLVWTSSWCMSSSKVSLSSIRSR